MSNEINFLITLSNGNYLIRVAVKAKTSMFTGDAVEFCLEPENKKQFEKLLSDEQRSFGKIVEVEEIHDIRDLTY